MRFIPAAMLAVAWAAPAPAQGLPRFAGTWDLTWQTRHGPHRKGLLVIEQQGSRLTAEIRGQGHVKAKGEATGNAFTLHGSHLAVPYTINGRLEADQIRGSLQILSLMKYFTGTRRLN